MISPYGLDVGKDQLHVCQPIENLNPRDWPVTTINLKDPHWWRTLLDLIDSRALIAAEATGYHWFAPIARLLITDLHASIWYVDGRTTRSVRTVNISKHKTDDMDARAIALIARRLASGQPQAGCHPFNLDELTEVNHLRLLVNSHRRTTKAITRHKNQLHALAHSIWPLLSQKLTTWRTCLSHDCVSPAQIHWLANPANIKMDGRRRRPIRQLADLMPPLPADAIIEQQALHIDRQTRTAELEQADILQQISQHLTEPPFIENHRRWSTIPGASDLWIAAFLIATYARPETFERDNLVAAIGAPPIWKSSGGQHNSRPRKSGYRPALDALHMWTLQLLNPNHAPNPIHTYYHGRATRKLAAARTKFARLLWLVINDPNGYHYKS